MSCIMPWQSSFPCHRMCCGPATLLWFALSVFRVADKIGIDGHVSFLPQKKKKKKKLSGPSFWSHGSAASRGVAVLFRAAAHTADISIRHQSADGRILSVDFSFAGGEFTITSIYAPCTAADRAAFFIQHLLPSLPAQRQLLLGGDFNCIADQLDMVDPAGAAGARMAGYYDGLRIVETEHQLYDVWRDRHPDGRTFTHAGTAGLSAARLDRWLLSQQLRPWVSTAWDSLTQTAGYPGDHIGVGVTLTAPGGTCFGRAAWRLPLQILDDEAFCDDMAAMILQYLEAHPVTAQLSRGQRWVHLKRSIRLFASSRVLAAAKMRRQALTALEADSRAAQAQYETHPTDAGALLQWRQAHHTLQQLNAGASQAAALQAGVVWQHYGEQSTF